MLKVKDFFEHRISYSPIAVETIDGCMDCKSIYSEGDWGLNYSREAEKDFLEKWGEEAVSGWCIIGLGEESEGVLLRIEIN